MKLLFLKLRLLSFCVVVAIVVFVASPAFAETLPSWNEGTAKKAIVQFVKDVSTTGSPKFVPQVERIAVFDNDGTLCGIKHDAR